MNVFVDFEQFITTQKEFRLNNIERIKNSNEPVFRRTIQNLGISREVYEFGEKIEESLKERFAEIDARAEYNQMKS